MTSCQQPYGTSTATRWPARKSAPGAQDRTTPAASMPGVYGNATPHLVRAPGLQQVREGHPAAATSMTTPPSAADSADSAGSATLGPLDILGPGERRDPMSEHRNLRWFGPFTRTGGTRPALYRRGPGTRRPDAPGRNSHAGRPCRPSPPEPIRRARGPPAAGRCTRPNRFGLRPTCAANRRRRVRGSRPSRSATSPTPEPRASARAAAITAGSGQASSTILPDQESLHHRECLSGGGSPRAMPLPQERARTTAQPPQPAPCRRAAAPAAARGSKAPRPARTSPTRARDPLRTRSPRPGRSARRPWLRHLAHLAGPADTSETRPG